VLGTPGWSRKGWRLEALSWEAKALDGLELPEKVHPWRIEFYVGGKILEFVCVKSVLKDVLNGGQRLVSIGSIEGISYPSVNETTKERQQNTEKASAKPRSIRARKIAILRQQNHE